MSAPVTATVATTRRVQALLADGYTPAVLAKSLAWEERWIRDLADGGEASPAVADLMRRAYDKFAGRPGPNFESAENFRRAGYAPPLAWEDIDVDSRPRYLRRPGPL